MRPVARHVDLDVKPGPFALTAPGVGGAFIPGREIPEEREVLTATTGTKKCVVHFYHPDFVSCAIVNQHLEKLAHQHFMTKFVKFNVQKGPWLCQKLKIQTLPAVVSFIDGIAKDRFGGRQLPSSFVTPSSAFGGQHRGIRRAGQHGQVHHGAV